MSEMNVGKSRLAKNILLTLLPPILVMMILLSGIGYVYSRNMIQEEIGYQMQYKLEQTISDIDKSLIAHKRLGETLAKSVAVNPSALTISEYEDVLKNFVALNPDTFGVGVWFEPNIYKDLPAYSPYAYRDGSDIVIDNSYWEDNYNIWADEWYRIGADSDGNGAWSEPYYDPVTDVTMITFSYPTNKRI